MGDCVNVKSLDNRAGCYVLIEALRAIKASRKKPSCNFVAAFTVQEEVGLRGAQAGTLDIQPDFSIALDVTIACDIPGTPAHDQVSHLGAGAAIKLYDGSVIADRRMVKFMKAMADANKIKWQTEMLPAGGTDAGAMQKFVPGGSIAGAISVPTRNVHQVIEMAHKDDLDASVALLTACAMNVDKWDWSWNSVNECPAENPPRPQNGSQARQSRCQEEKGQITGLAIHSSLPGRPHRKRRRPACFQPPSNVPANSGHRPLPFGQAYRRFLRHPPEAFSDGPAIKNPPASRNAGGETILKKKVTWRRGRTLPSGRERGPELLLPPHLPPLPHLLPDR